MSSAAGDHSRKNYAGYIDFALAPIEALQLDVAGRAEHYTDFGDTQIGKITARYDFNPQWAIRGTISTGFRAPTMAEEFYTAVNVSPTSATAQLPADSAAAKVLGLHNLKPEISTSYQRGHRRPSAAGSRRDGGRLFDRHRQPHRPLRDGVIDGWRHQLRRWSIMRSPPTALPRSHRHAGSAPRAFLNGITTLTQGVDLTVNYPTDFGAYGLVDWTLAANYNETADLARSADAGGAHWRPMRAQPSSIPTRCTISSHSAPATKIGLTANWSLDEFGVTLRETYYGPAAQLDQPRRLRHAQYLVHDPQAGVGITDLEVRYNVTEELQFAVGANNLFNIRPDADAV